MEKTCGNCGNCRAIGNGCGVCLEGYSGPLSNEVPVVLLSGSCTIVPDSWCQKRSETLEQRYQQLAQVARKMLKHLCSVCDGGDVYNEDIADYREGLEELGVEL